MDQIPQIQPIPQLQPQPPMISGAPKNSSKKVWLWMIIAAIIIAALVILGWLWWQSYINTVAVPQNAPAAQAPAPVLPADNTASIDKDLQGINIESVDQNFRDIDTDLNSL